jgi:hypothetical protein
MEDKEPSVAITLLHICLPGLNGNGDEHSSVLLEYRPYGVRGVEELILREMHEDGGTQNAVETAAERQPKAGQRARIDAAREFWVGLERERAHPFDGLHAIGLEACGQEGREIAAGTEPDVQDPSAGGEGARESTGVRTRDGLVAPGVLRGVRLIVEAGGLVHSGSEVYELRDRDGCVP